MFDIVSDESVKTSKLKKARCNQYLINGLYDTKIDGRKCDRCDETKTRMSRIENNIYFCTCGSVLDRLLYRFSEQIKCTECDKIIDRYIKRELWFNIYDEDDIPTGRYLCYDCNHEITKIRKDNFTDNDITQMCKDFRKNKDAMIRFIDARILRKFKK